MLDIGTHSNVLENINIDREEGRGFMCDWNAMQWNAEMEWKC